MSRNYPVYTRNDLEPLGTRNVEDECTRGEYKDTCLYFNSAGWLKLEEGEKLSDVMCVHCYKYKLDSKIATDLDNEKCQQEIRDGKYPFLFDVDDDTYEKFGFPGMTHTKDFRYTHDTGIPIYASTSPPRTTKNNELPGCYYMFNSK